MDISLFALSGLLIAISSLTMALVMFSMGRSSLQFLWGVFCLSVFIWGLGGFFAASTTDPDIAKFWWKIIHVGVAFIPAFFLHFVYNFLNKKVDFVLFIAYILATSFAILSLSSNLLIDEMRYVFDEFYYDSPPGLLYPFLTLFFFGLTAFSHFILWQSYQKTSDVLKRSRIRYFFLATVIGFLGGGLSFLPVYEIDIYPITNFAVVIYPIVMGYAIIKHNLFDIKVATAQGLVFLLWIFVAVRLVISPSLSEFIINGVLFISVLVLGTFLVYTINKEINTRQEIEKLAKSLARANKRLQAIDKQKSEFVSIASHQLRSPLTAVRGYASMLLEGSFGKFPKKAHNAVEHIEESARMMAMSIEDYLNVSRIESGNMKYDCVDFNLQELASTITDDLRSEATKSGLVLSFKSDTESRAIVHADKGKVQQILHNLINNSLKYTKQGSITVFVHDDTKKDKIYVEIIDTGIGMSEETQHTIFAKFQRAKGASEVNVHGTGLGLFVAKKMAVEMDGDITAYSEGEGKGSHFILELPLKN